MKEIKIEGFTYDSTPENKPAICVFGEENVGKSRFGCTAPHEDGVIGWLALDKNSKGAVDDYKKATGADYIMVNSVPFLSHKEAIKVALLDNPDETKKIYKEVVSRLFDRATDLAGHKSIESIVIDDGSQFFDYLLFSHFGRRNQIESYQRGGVNNDFIDFLNAMGSKNLVMVCRGAEIWADTGQVDKQGKKIQAPTGRLKPEGFGKIGKFMTATLELTAKRKKPSSQDSKEALEEKYRVKVVTCKGNTLLEGQDLAEYGVSGQNITWENILAVTGTGTGAE